ncbi:hypothetical protein FDUTEX481_06540 [Tolypothrix sp. PCC 7601]|nr:hypothetical protein FDUTEX481_06540 [Tolypothrix sp. PCC 7601]
MDFRLTKSNPKFKIYNLKFGGAWMCRFIPRMNSQGEEQCASLTYGSSIQNLKSKIR